jgi:hypothetical protein
MPLQPAILSVPALPTGAVGCRRSLSSFLETAHSRSADLQWEEKALGGVSRDEHGPHHVPLQVRILAKEGASWWPGPSPCHRPLAAPQA